jgi:phosphopantetheine adenylyltransferase
MNKFEEFVDKHFRKIALFLLIVILFNTCGNPVKPLNKRVDALSTKIDSLSTISVNKKDLVIEGLKSEKRMIQSVSRNLVDRERERSIDKELDSLSKN